MAPAAYLSETQLFGEESYLTESGYSGKYDKGHNQDILERRKVEMHAINSAASVFSKPIEYSVRAVDQMATFGLLLTFLSILTICELQGVDLLGNKNMYYGRDLGVVTLIMTCVVGLGYVVFTIGIAFSHHGRNTTIYTTNKEYFLRVHGHVRGREGYQIMAVWFTLTAMLTLLLVVGWVTKHAGYDSTNTANVLNTDKFHATILGQYDHAKTYKEALPFLKLEGVYIAKAGIAVTVFLLCVPVLVYLVYIAADDKRPWVADGLADVKMANLHVQNVGSFVYAFSAAYAIARMVMSVICAAGNWDEVVPHNLFIADTCFVGVLFMLQLGVLVWMYHREIITHSYTHTAFALMTLGFTFWFGKTMYVYTYVNMAALPEDHDFLALQPVKDLDQVTRATWIFMNLGLFAISTGWALSAFAAAYLYRYNLIPLTPKSMADVQTNYDTFQAMLSNRKKYKLGWYAGVVAVLTAWLAFIVIRNLILLQNGPFPFSVTTWRWVDIVVGSVLALAVGGYAVFLSFWPKIYFEKYDKEVSLRIYDRVRLGVLALFCVMLIFVLIHGMVNLNSDPSTLSRGIDKVDEDKPEPTGMTAIRTWLLFHSTLHTQNILIYIGMVPLISTFLMALGFEAEGRVSLPVSSGTRRDMYEEKRKEPKRKMVKARQSAQKESTTKVTDFDT